MQIVTPDTFNIAIQRLRGFQTLVFDFETTGLRMFAGDRILGLAVKGLGDDVTSYFPFEGYEPKTFAGLLNQQDSPALAYDVIQDSPLVDLLIGRQLIGHNAKFDLKFLYAACGQLPAKVIDTRVGASLLDENESHALKALGDKYIGAGSSDEQTELLEELAALGFKTKDQAMKHLGELSVELVAKYAVQDVELTEKLARFQARELARRGNLRELWTEYNEFLLALCRMECRGLMVDMEKVDKLTGQAQRDVQQQVRKLRDITGRPKLNPGSPQQIGKLLGIESTEADELERLEKAGNYLAGEVLKYRKLNKTLTTYYEPYHEHVNPDGAIHCDLFVGGARTGRLSCRDPNLQQVPRDAEAVKSCFVARPGYVLVEADYEQAELRLAAHLANEQNMIEAFLSGQDPHQATADNVGTDRQSAKTLNFGILYGMGASALAGQLDVSEDEARGLLEDFHKAYPGFRKAYQQAAAQARGMGFVKLWTGRIRRFPDPDFAHKAFNSLIQGGVAEIVRRAITHIDQHYDYLNPVLTVHDSILFEMPEDKVWPYVVWVETAMKCDNYLFKVPQDVEIKAGPTWGDMKVIKLEGVTHAA